jgi:hypothetical protein
MDPNPTKKWRIQSLFVIVLHVRAKLKAHVVDDGLLLALSASTPLPQT